MINAVHAVIYTNQPGAVRQFFADKLNLPSVDAGGGWLIFALPPAELGIHPTAAGEEHGKHLLYFMCDDAAATKRELETKGVEFTMPIKEQRFGYLTAMRLPDGQELFLYQPTHSSPLK